MKSTEFWFWMMTDPWGRRRRSTCRFTQAQALAIDPSATPVDGTLEVRSCPENDDERARLAPTNQHLIGQDGKRGRSTAGIG